MMDINIKWIVTATGLRADQTGLIGFGNSLFKNVVFVAIFATNIDITMMRTHRDGGQQATFDKGMGIIAHDLPVLTGAGL